MNYISKTSRVPILLDSIYDDIKESFTGGSVDMFIPKPDNNELVYAYDVNSLYPYAMKNEMPVAFFNKELNSHYITYFEGDISIINKNPYGFLKVNVTSPENLEHPILQLKCDIKTINQSETSTFRTISPLGK